VHLTLYIGAAAVLVTIGFTLGRRLRRATVGVALPIAFGSAVLSVAGEAWHAVSHLQLDTHSAPVAGSLSVAGFLAVVAAMTVPRLVRGQPAGAARDERRAA
jgi:Na+/citrate or Na+/malate symporter